MYKLFVFSFKQSDIFYPPALNRLLFLLTCAVKMRLASWQLFEIWDNESIVKFFQIIAWQTPHWCCPFY